MTRQLIQHCLSCITPGLIYGIGSIGLAVILRFLKFPDLTVLSSIMAGGVVCIWATNHSNAVIGILSGAVAGGCLGSVTGMLARYLRIEPILASIITFTGSSTLGYLLANTGGIDLPEGAWGILAPDFCISDVCLILVFVAMLVVIGSFVMKTRFGSLVLAMTGDPRFVKYRHRFSDGVFISILVCGNGIVGFAGSLFALHARGAYVHTHPDFLPYSLGAIFGGNAVAMWLSKKLKHKQLTSFLTGEQDDTKTIGVLFLLYVVGALLLYVISGLVTSNAFAKLHPILSIKQTWQRLTEAILITFCLWWAAANKEDSEE